MPSIRAAEAVTESPSGGTGAFPRYSDARSSSMSPRSRSHGTRRMDVAGATEMGKPKVAPDRWRDTLADDEVGA